VRAALRAQLVAKVGLKIAPGPDVLYVGTILQHTFLLLELEVVCTVDIGEAPLAGDDDLLTTGELVTGTAESLRNNSGLGVFASDREDDLANVDASYSAVGLAPGATHTGLETIRTGTGEHFIDADDVERVHTNAKMERVLARSLGNILVGANTGGFESL